MWGQDGMRRRSGAEMGLRVGGVSKEGAEKRAQPARVTRTAPEAERAGGTLSGAHSQLLAMRSAIGNRAVVDLLAVGQPKLEVGAADDRLEVEADAMARQVVQHLSDRRAGREGARPTVDRDQATEVASRVADGGGADVGFEGGDVSPETEEAIQRARSSGGKPLDGGARSAMEGALGADFSGVRLHTGPAAAELNDRIQAKAFTVGNDIFFRGAAPDVARPSGQELLAHELTHTIQQGASVGRSTDGVVRRMPTPTKVRSQSGKKSKKANIFGRGATASYDKVLAALGKHSDYIIKTEIAGDEVGMRLQVATINALIDEIVAACTEYVNKDKPDQDVVPVLNQIIADAPYERLMVGDVGAYWAKKYAIGGLGHPKWFSQLKDDPKTYTFRKSDMAPKVVGQETGDKGKGANKEVKGVTLEGRQGFFAEDDAPGGKYQDEKWANPRWMLENYGHQDQNLRLGQRSIAMSRLDQLLGANVIARTQLAVKDGKFGTFLDKAQGKEGRNMNDDEFVAASETKDLPRLLSKLQLIDAIAGQVDRHMGNFFILHENGKVKVTGIDLDMAWMLDKGRQQKGGPDLKFDVEQESDKYPGFSRYVDRETAEAIIKMRPEDLRAILLDLLDSEQVDAAVLRLGKLQVLLKDLQSKGELLEPDDWNEAIRAKLVTEKKSYYGEFGGYAQDMKKNKK